MASVTPDGRTETAKIRTVLSGVRLTLLRGDPIEVTGLRSVVPSHSQGVDYYAATTFRAEVAARLPVGITGRLTIETKDAKDGSDGPWFIVEDSRTFRVVSNLYGGGHKEIGYFLVTFACDAEG